MKLNYGRALMLLGDSIYRATQRAWRRIAAGGLEFGDLRGRLRLADERVARLEAECELLRVRLARIEPSCRPHYARHARFEILWHVRRWGLSLADAAKTFLLSPETLGRWFKLQQAGNSVLVVPRRAINRLSDLTRELVRRLVLEQADWGTQRICDVLVRLGISLSRRSVQRIRREGSARGPRPVPDRTSLGCPVVAKYPNHLWMADLTSIGTPSIRQIFIAGIVDVFSRKVLALRAWARVPTAADVRALLREAIRLFGAPRYLVTDRGTQFKADVLSRFLQRRGVSRRYGAVARWQSVAVIDRFFGALKAEYAFRWLLLLPVARVNQVLHGYVLWHARHRPHQGLGGRTPEEVFHGRRRATPEGQVVGVRLTYLKGDDRLPVYRALKAA
jgi:putative transposase